MNMFSGSQQAMIWTVVGSWVPPVWHFGVRSLGAALQMDAARLAQSDY